MIHKRSGIPRLVISLVVSATAVSALATENQPREEASLFGDDEQSAQCAVVEPTATGPISEERRVHRRATVLIGADVLGRIAVAADYDGDEYVDEEMLFTATTRLSEPTPVLLKNARLTWTVSSLVVEARDRSLAVALSVDGDGFDHPRIPRSWKRYSQVIVNEDGVAFGVKSRPPGYEQHLSAYDHNSLYTWYPGFERDVLYTGTGGSCQSGCTGCTCHDANWNCTTGGCGAATCGCASPCSGGVPQACGNGYFACCKCNAQDGSNPPVYWCFGDCIPCSGDLPP